MKNFRSPLVLFLLAFFGQALSLAVGLLSGGEYEPSLGKFGTFQFGAAVAVASALLAAGSLFFITKVTGRVVSALSAAGMAIITFVSIYLYYMWLGDGELYRELWHVGWLMLVFIPCIGGLVFGKK